MAPKKGAAQQRKSEIYTNVYFFYDFGRWGVWAREPRVGGARLFIGTHLTERLAARCQDRALLKMETEPWTTKEIKLNFKREDYAEDEDLVQNHTVNLLVRNSTTTADFVKYLSGESRGKYNKLQPTACLLKFLAEEEAPLEEEGPLKEEGPLGIPAPKKPVSRGKRPRSTNTKQNKKPKTKGEWDTSNEKSDYCPSKPEVYATLPLAAVAPVVPLLQWTGKRSIANRRARQFALVAPLAVDGIGNRQALEGPVAPWTTERLRPQVNRAISKVQEGAFQALQLQLMPSKEEEDLHQALLMITSGRGIGGTGVSAGVRGAISKDEEEAAEALLVLSLGTGRGTV